jgi:hypothetical protein
MASVRSLWANFSVVGYVMFHACVWLFALLGLAGCANQRPVLYPNEQFKRLGNAAAERDTSDCMRQAEEYVSANDRTASVMQGAATGAATNATVGAAAGAAGGAVVGRVGTGAAVGAAGAGAAGLTRGLIHGFAGKRSPSPVYKNFVNRCLRDKGYEPIGWQ